MYLKVVSETSLVQKVGKALLRRVIFESIVLCVFAFFVSSASSLGDPCAITTTTIYSPRDPGYRTKSIMYRTRSNTFKFGRQLLPFFSFLLSPSPLDFPSSPVFLVLFYPKGNPKELPAEEAKTASGLSSSGTQGVREAPLKSKGSA